MIDKPHPGVARITLNRPERLNAINNELLTDFSAALDDADTDPEVRCVVLTGAGRGFCAGADLKAGVQEVPGAEGFGPILNTFAYQQRIVAVVTRLRRLRKPVIAAVNGVTRGAGNNMAFSADFRIASEQANFGCNFVERGLMAEASAYYLPRLVGMAIATEICLLGEPFDAAQAKAWGIVNKVVPHDKLMDEAMALARKINSKAPIAVRMTKQALHRAHDQSAEQFLDMQNTMNTKLRYTADAKEALAAFIEKRPAKFQNK